ncbi:hypothetical protein ABHA01_02815 [Clostridium paraputrificum]|uniref:hypothetical protein n=1 Tax=Clostridium paraputrificum TaxID=29363 RepID=UPI00325B2B8D
MKLEIELIPRTCWNSNIRTRVKKSDWDKIRKAVYQKENMYCHICGKKCNSLDAHEVWEYDEINHIQKLTNIIGICKACHNTIHYGRAQQIGYEKEARNQFLKVNECEIIDLEKELIKVKEDYNRRSQITDWNQDLSFVTNQGFAIKEE